MTEAVDMRLGQRCVLGVIGHEQRGNIKPEATLGIYVGLRSRNQRFIVSWAGAQE